MFKFLFTFFILFIYFDNVNAQVDTEFWFAAPEVTSLHADEPVLLRMSNFYEEAIVTILQPSNPSFPVIVKKIPARATLSIDLTPFLSFIENDIPGEVANKGIHISSTSGITVYYEVLGKGHNAEIFVLKGNNALGKKFFIPSQTYWNNLSGIEAYCSFDIVAAEDNTLINILPKQGLYPDNLLLPVTIKLNKGQTYSARAYSPSGIHHPSGSRVTANKNIAITYKDDSLLEHFHWDLVGDQLIPTTITGNKYIAVKISDTTNTDRLFICPTMDATMIHINGKFLGNYNAGDTVNFQILTKTSYIESNFPIYVFHVGGFEYELGGALLPSLVCSGSRAVSILRSTSEKFALAILVKTGNENNFLLNGEKFINQEVFLPVAGTNMAWKYAVIYPNSLIPALTTSIISNTSGDFHLSTWNGGNNTGFRYGYFSDYGFLNLGSDKSLCPGEEIFINAGVGKLSYSWTNFTTGMYLGSDPILVVKDSGIYQVNVTKDTCSFSDQVKIAINPTIEKPILSTDTSACDGSKIIISSIKKMSYYIWSNGDTTISSEISKSGEYILKAFNKYGCSESDTINVLLHSPPSPTINFEENFKTFCRDSTIHLNSKNNYEKYLWSTGDTNKFISTSHTYPDSINLEVIDSNSCKGSTSITIDCSTFIGDIPNLLTPNEDTKNEILYIPYLESSSWSLEIYNRWGAKVYMENPYQNKMPGKYFEDGVYFYVLTHRLKNNILKGWINIMR